MIKIIYLSIVLFGCAMLLIVIKKREQFSKNLQMISREKTEPVETPEPTVEYEALLEHGSKWIKLLSQLKRSIAIKGIISACGGTILFLLNLTSFIELSMKIMLLIMPVIFVMVSVVSNILLKMAIGIENKKLMNDIPAFIDLVAVIIQSGMTIESSLNYAIEKFVHLNKSLTLLIERVMRHAEVSSLEDALKSFAHSIPTIEIKMFSFSLRQSLHFGTSVYQQLMELSKDIRDLQLLETEERIAKLPAKNDRTFDFIPCPAEHYFICSTFRNESLRPCIKFIYLSGYSA